MDNQFEIPANLEMPNEEKSQKIKMLYLGDYVCGTGFGTVSRNIIDSLITTGDYEVDVIGINYNGDPYDANVWKGNVFPAHPGGMVQPPYNDVYGRQRFLDRLGTGIYDVAMVLQDSFVMRDCAPQLKETAAAAKTALVYYYPVDSILDESWVKGVVDIMDFPVVYTKFGKEETLKIEPKLESRLGVIYHGNNFAEFNYIEDREFVKQERHNFFDGKADDRFLIMNVSRNQIRKDILHSLLTIKEVRKHKPEALLYLHMADRDQGGIISEYAAQLGLKREEDYIVPYAFNQGQTIEAMNVMYNFSDLFLSSTHGEGWGLPITEAFATKTPVIAPNNTSLTEIGADNRACLIDCDDYHTYSYHDNLRVRPVMNYKKAADAIVDYMNGDLFIDVDGAHEWLKQYSWQNVCMAWDRILRQAAELTEKRRNVPQFAKPPVSGPPKAQVTKKRKQERQNKKRARR